MSDKVVVEGPRSATRGAQVRITGDAQEAARGGLAGDFEGNVRAKQAMEARGEVPDGLTADGTTRTGAPPPDEVVTTKGEPSGDIPAKPAENVEVKRPQVSGAPTDAATTAAAKPAGQK